MNKPYLFPIFITIASSIYVALHYYVYSRISTGLGLTPHQTFLFRMFIWIGAASFFLSEVLTRRYIASWTIPVTWLGFVWLGLISIAFTVLLFRDITLIFFQTPGYKHISVLISLPLICAISLYSLWNAGLPQALKVVEVKTDKLPAKFDGFTIVQLSDIHVDMQTPVWWLNGIVERANALKPDLIVITGDILDADLFKNMEYVNAFKALAAKHGVIATTGNHEFYVGIDKFTNLTSYCGMKTLRGESVTIAGNIVVVGIDDTEVKRFGETGRNLQKALSGPAYDKQKLVILLSHRPDIFDEAAADGINLTLSGHTHWGQIPPADIFVKLFQKYSIGYNKKNGSAIYTTSGTGTWGPPMRLFSRNEIVKIVLKTK